MYEDLTVYLEKLGNGEYGEWIIDRENDGTPEHPIRFPFVAYSREVDDFYKSVYQFIDQHKEMNLTNYGRILEEAGIKWSMKSMEHADASQLDGQTVMALIVGAIRAERFCDGALLDFFENGSIGKWLLRLKEIDEKNNREDEPI